MENKNNKNGFMQSAQNFVNEVNLVVLIGFLLMFVLFNLNGFTESFIEKTQLQQAMFSLLIGVLVIGFFMLSTGITLYALSRISKRINGNQ